MADKVLSLRLRENTSAVLERRARTRGVSASAYIRFLIMRGLEIDEHANANERRDLQVVVNSERFAQSSRTKAQRTLERLAKKTRGLNY